MTLNLDSSNIQPAKETTRHARKKSRVSASELVVKTITDGIFSGRFVPGQRLVEADLTNELQVSRGPVREALKRLSAERIINLTPHRGAYIRSFTCDEVDDTLRVMEVLMGLAADLAARNIDDDNNRQYFIHMFNKLMIYKEQQHTSDLLQERNQFYKIIIDLSGNDEIARLMPLAEIHLLRTQFQTQLRFHKHFDEYEYIGKAILAGIPHRAQRSIRKHLRETRKILCSLPDKYYASVRD